MSLDFIHCTDFFFFYFLFLFQRALLFPFQKETQNLQSPVFQGSNQGWTQHLQIFFIFFFSGLSISPLPASPQQQL